MTTLANLTPKRLNYVINLVRSAGIDVTDWPNYRGGEERPGANPKYCYEWAFVRPGSVVVLNLWMHQLEELAGEILWRINLRKFAKDVTPIRHRRARKFREAIKTAFEEGLPVRVILCKGADGVQSNTNSVKARELDYVNWAVTEYDEETGNCTISRGATPVSGVSEETEDQAEGFEGAKTRAWLRAHRQREGKLRQQKIAQVQKKNNGRLRCEVPKCGFDFEARYGPIGAGYAHVHHIEPLSAAPNEGRRVSLSDLAVVCANCHMMIHIGGQCRTLDTLIP
jgi:5-methylcytosine-specific restriction enzyme A